MTKKFLRRTGNRYSKLGKGRKKKQVWRKPKGRDNKMREKRKGKPVVVSIGYKKPETKKTQVLVINNINDLKKVNENQSLVIGSIGKKKKIEIAKKAKEMKIQIHNLNIKNFLKKTEKLKPKEKEKKEEKPKDNKK